MPKYTVTATRETYYEFEIEAADELDAEDQVRQLEIEGDIETYAYDWYPLEIEAVEEEEEEEEE
jgi:vancomycin permeability regulator SanA